MVTVGRLGILVLGALLAFGCRGEPEPTPTPPAKAEAAAPAPGVKIDLEVDGVAKPPLTIEPADAPRDLRDLAATTGWAELRAKSATGREVIVDLEKFADNPLLVTTEPSGVLRLTLHRGSRAKPGVPVLAVSKWTSLEGRSPGYEPQRASVPLVIDRFGRDQEVTSDAFAGLPGTAWRSAPKEAASARRLSDVLGLAGSFDRATSLEIRDAKGNSWTLEGPDLSALDAILMKFTNSGVYNLKGPKSLAVAQGTTEDDWRVRDVRLLRLVR